MASGQITKEAAGKVEAPAAYMVIVGGGGTTDAPQTVIVVHPDGSVHVVHIPGNNPDPWYRDMRAQLAAAQTLTEEAKHASDAHVRAQLTERATEFYRGAAESAKAQFAK